MTDQEKLEKIIKGLEEVKDFIKFENLPAHSIKALLNVDDAIALLKTRTPLDVLHKEPGCMSGRVGYCPKCGAVLLENCYNPKYCGVCGQAVKW